MASGTRLRWRTLGLALGIVLFGYGLRAHRIANPALRGDEAFSVRFASQPVSTIWAAMATSEPNPPVYWFTLHTWMQLAGSSELTVRWISVLAGTALIALAIRLGRNLLGRRAAHAGALLIALNPFLVWYSQDTRAYSLLTLLVLGAVWLTWQAARHNHWGDWAGAGVLWGLAGLTHYFAVIPALAASLTFLLVPALRARWRAALTTALGLGAALALYLAYVSPLLLSRAQSWKSPVNAFQALGLVLTAVTTWTPSTTIGWETTALGVALAGLVLAAGLWEAIRLRSVPAAWTLGGGLGVPVLLWLVSLSRSVFAEQYFIAAVPLILLAAGLGLAAFRSRRGLMAAALAGLCAAALIALASYFYDARSSKSNNWRALTAYLEATERASEVIVVNLPDPAIYYYYRGASPIEVSPPGYLPSIGQAAAEAQLQRLRDSYQHIRFLPGPSPFYDPEGFAGQWLAACCEMTAEAYVGGFHIQSYDTPTGSLTARQPFVIDFEHGIRLTGFRVSNANLHPGDRLHFTLYWQAEAPVLQSYSIFVHVLAPDGFEVVNGDGLPAAGRRPTDQWPAGEVIIDPHAIDLPGGLPPNTYTLHFGLYVLETGERLKGADASGVAGDEFVLPAAITVTAP